MYQSFARCSGHVEIAVRGVTLFTSGHLRVIVGGFVFFEISVITSGRT